MGIPRKIIEGQPVLVVVDIQNGETRADGTSPIPRMPGRDLMVENAMKLIKTARSTDIPLIFIQEAHRRDGIDFGRELDGAEDVHCLEGDHGTEIMSCLGMKEDDYFIRKRRYSCFFGTDFEILVRGIKADTLIFIGGLTDVCVHYSFADGHQSDFYCRVVEDCVSGSSLPAHKASLEAMEYLQTGARRSTADMVEAMQNWHQRQPDAIQAAR
jgi:nicotinamidase-related amidase